MTDRPDSGWGSAARSALTALIPTRGARLAQRGTNGLLVLRQLWCSFAGAMVLFALLAVLASAGVSSSVDGRIVAGVVVAAGVIAQLMGMAFVAPVRGPSVDDVRRSAQRHVLVRVALAEVSALAGVIGAFVSANLAVYGIGAVVALAGLIDAAPSDRWLAARQADLDAEGTAVDLRDALESAGLTR